jgi:hypothetical protein
MGDDTMTSEAPTTRGLARSISVLCLVALAGTAAPLPLLTSAAYARSENAGDNGNAGGNGGGNGGGSGGGRSEEARGTDQGSDRGNGVGRDRAEQARGIGDSTGSTRGNSGNARGGDGTVVRLFGQTIRFGAHEDVAGARAARPARSTEPTDLAPVVSRAPASRPQGVGNSLAVALGAHPSELGALNAARASEQAFLNASPNSRVGRIAAYRDAVLSGQMLEEDLAKAQAALEALPESRPADDIAADQATNNAEKLKVEGEIAALRLEAETAAEEDLPAIEEEIAALEETLAGLDETAAALTAEAEQAAIRAEAEALVAELEAQLDGQPATERALLDAAANKPVTDAVEAEVRRILGLDG